MRAFITRRLVIAAASAAAVLLALAACQQIKDAVPADTKLGRAIRAGADLGQAWADTQITPEDQMEIGRGVSAQLIATFGLSNDESLTHYVELVGTVVASASDRPDVPFHFGLLDTMEVNAFSTPGGFVFITKGTLLTAASEAELAGILGHEIAHVCLEHGLNAVKRGIWQKGIVTAGSSAANVKIDQSNFGPIVDLASDAVLKKRDRGEELEADRVGTTYAAAAGYNPGGVRAFLDHIKAKGQKNDPSTQEMFATHPTPEDRLAELAAAMKQNGLDDPRDARPWVEDRFRATVQHRS